MPAAEATATGATDRPEEPADDAETDEASPAEDAAGATDGSETAAAERTSESLVTTTERWEGVGALSLIALGLGVITGTAAPMLASVFGLAFAGYSSLTTAPEPTVTVERELSDVDPDPGAEVRVTVTVTNEGDSSLPDLRVIDGVPERLGVTAGSPRQGAALRPGATTTFSYSIEAEFGEHRFEPATVIARDVSGSQEVVETVGTATTIRSLPNFPADTPTIPLRSKVSQFTGRFPGDTGGAGVEFHATRQYRRGDPLNRVDWRHTARTGELTTVQFRVERTVRVCLVFDVREQGHLAPEDSAASAVERSLDAGITAYTSLTEAGHAVGISTIGPTDCWLGPGAGDRHRTAVRHLFGTHPALSPIPPEADADIYQATQRLKGRLSSDSQVLLFTPLCDDRILATAVRLEAHGYAVTVLSPDVTSTETAGGNYARTMRRLRIADLRSRGIPVVDWGPEEDLGKGIARTASRWSQ